MKFARWLALVAVVVAATVPAAGQTEYTTLWEKAVPFETYLAGVKARAAQWKSRYANAAIRADVLNDVKALPGRRRILAVAIDRCSDSAWALPYIGKLAAAAPEKLELRVIDRSLGSAIQSANLTPDGRIATPTLLILDEENRPLGAWVERPAELQKWFIDNKASMETGPLHQHMDDWYKTDAGRSTIREVLDILKKTAGGK